MPLFDSLSTSQVHRLPKMNSVPTTDDLRYAMQEAQKRIGKTIELPFEHPHNHQLFVVKLVLSVGNKVPPIWTLQKGDGPNAKRLWNRSAEDVLMVQSKIKIDAQYVPQDGEPDTAPVSQPMSLGVGVDMENPFTAGSSGDPFIMGGAPSQGAGSDAPVQQSNFYAQSNQQAMNAFAAPPQVTPAANESWIDDLVQPPSFNPKTSRQNMPALHPGTAAAVPPPPPKPAGLAYDYSSGMPASASAQGMQAMPAPGQGMPPSASAQGMPAMSPAASAQGMPAYAPAPGMPASASAQGMPAMPAASPTPEAGAPTITPVVSQHAPKPIPPSPVGVLPLPPPIKLDTNLVAQVLNTITEPSTGLSTFAGFVFFLFKEFAFHQIDACPLSVVVFEVALRIGNENVSLPAPALQTIVDRIKSVSTPLEVISHLSGGEFVALLASRDAAGALEFADRLHAGITAEPLGANNRNETVLCAVGAATIPLTCNEPEVLIAAARQAKEVAKTLTHPILLFPAQ